MAKGRDRAQSEAATQAKLHGRTVDTNRQTDNDRPYEGFHLGDESGRRAGAGEAGQGSNRSERD